MQKERRRGLGKKSLNWGTSWASGRASPEQQHYSSPTLGGNVGVLVPSPTFGGNIPIPASSPHIVWEGTTSSTLIVPTNWLEQPGESMVWCECFTDPTGWQLESLSSLHFSERVPSSRQVSEVYLHYCHRAMNTDIEQWNLIDIEQWTLISARESLGLVELLPMWPGLSRALSCFCRELHFH